MSHTALKTLIDSEPLNAAKTDAEVLTWLNEDVTSYADVPWLDYAIWLSGNGGVSKMQNEVNNASQEIANGCQLGLAILNAGQPLSLSRTEVRTDLGVLVGAGKPFTTDERDALLAVSAEAKARWLTVMRNMDDVSKLHHIAEVRA